MDAVVEAVVELPAAALGPLAEHLGLACSPLSPVAFLLAHAGATKHLTPVDRVGAELLTALLQPEAVTSLRRVDAAGAVSWCCIAQARRSLRGHLAVASLDGPTLRIERLADPMAAAASLAPSLFTAAARPASSSLPREWPVGAFVDTFHAVDRFRRAYAEAMLAGAPVGDLVVRARDLVASLEGAAASADHRWLVPAFLHLTPGVRMVDVATGAAQLGRLLSAGVFRAPEGATDDPVLRFGEVGRGLGLEFARGWWWAVGVEQAVLMADGAHAMHRGFVASTVLANHWFTLRGEGGTLEHAALSGEEARARLAGLLAEADAVGEAAAWRLCPRCGHPAGAGAMRCTSCGGELAR